MEPIKQIDISSPLSRIIINKINVGVAVNKEWGAKNLQRERIEFGDWVERRLKMKLK
jgi:hypothetical protein